MLQTLFPSLTSYFYVTDYIDDSINK